MLTLVRFNTCTRSKTIPRIIRKIQTSATVNENNSMASVVVDVGGNAENEKAADNISMDPSVIETLPTLANTP